MYGVADVQTGEQFEPPESYDSTPTEDVCVRGCERLRRRVVIFGICFAGLLDVPVRSFNLIQQGRQLSVPILSRRLASTYFISGAHSRSAQQPCTARLEAGASGDSGAMHKAFGGDITEVHIQAGMIGPTVTRSTKLFRNGRTIFESRPTPIKRAR